MSGSGKSTVGKLLAQKLHRPLLDIDQMVEAAAGKSINEIFEEQGEAAFREKEAEQITMAAQATETVIVCGGGAVLFAKNMLILAHSGVIIYIDTSIEQILARTDFSDRPLLYKQPEQLYNMLQVRDPLYRKYAAYVAENSGTPEETAEKIITLIKRETKP